MIRAGITLKINVGAPYMGEAWRTNEEDKKKNRDAAIHDALAPDAREPIAECKPHARGEDGRNPG